MFHAAGWTYPWANVFAVATQVCLSWHAVPIYIDNLRPDYLANSELYPHLEPPPSFRSHSLLWCPNSPGYCTCFLVAHGRLRLPR